MRFGKKKLNKQKDIGKTKLKVKRGDK